MKEKHARPMEQPSESFIRKHPALTGLLLAFSIFLILFFIVEVSLRLFTPYPPPLFGFIKDRERGHFIRKSFYKQHAAPDGEPYEIQTNTLGLFDTEYNGESPTVLLIGDSFTISAVPFDSKWGTLLEKELKTRVVKAGVSAYGTEKEYLLLRSLAPTVNPRIIVLAHYLNDFVDDYIGIDRYTVVNGHLQEMKSLDPVSGEVYQKHIGGYIEALARHHLAAFGFFADKFREAGSRYLAIQPVIEEFDPTLGPLFDPDIEWTEKLYESNFRNILRVKEYADSIQAGLIVLVIPAKEQVYDNMWKKAYGDMPRYDRYLPNRRIVQFLGKNGITYINLMEVFEKEIAKQLPGEPPPQFYYDYDIHWNREGDRIVAETLARLILSQGLLADRGIQKKGTAQDGF